MSKGDAATLPTPVWGGSMGSLAKQGTTPSQPSMPVPGQYDGTGGTPDVFGGAYSSQPAQTTPAVTPPQQGTPSVPTDVQSTPAVSPAQQYPWLTQYPGAPARNFKEDTTTGDDFIPRTPDVQRRLTAEEEANYAPRRDQLAQLLMMIGGGRQL